MSGRKTELRDVEVHYNFPSGFRVQGVMYDSKTNAYANSILVGIHGSKQSAERARRAIVALIERAKATT